MQEKAYDKRLDQLEARLVELSESRRIRDEICKRVKERVESLQTLVTEEMYVYPRSIYANGGTNKDKKEDCAREKWKQSVDSIRSEIRAIKALLLSSLLPKKFC